MVFTTTPDLAPGQFEIRLGTDRPIPLAALRSLFFNLERITKDSDLFDGSVQLGLVGAEDGSLRLILAAMRRLRRKPITLSHEGSRFLRQQLEADESLERRMVEAAKRSASADERTASATEDLRDGTNKLVLIGIAAILVTVVTAAIEEGELSQPIYNIDQSFNLNEVSISSNVTQRTLYRSDLPDEQTVERVKQSSKMSSKHDLALRERRDFWDFIERSGRANVTGKLAYRGGTPVIHTDYGNVFELMDQRAGIADGERVFAILTLGRDGLLIPEFVEKIDKF